VAACCACGPAARLRWAAPIALAAAAAGCVALSGCLTLVGRSSGALPGWAARSVVAELHGQVSDDPKAFVASFAGRVGPPRWLVRVDVDDGVAHGAPGRVGAPVLVIGDETWSDLAAGQGVTVVGRLTAAEPGDDVAAVVQALGGPRDRTPGAWWWTAAQRVRGGLRQAAAGWSEDAGGLLPSLVLGDVSQLPQAVVDDLRVAGLTHLTAVSGANVAIVLGALLWLAAVARLPRAGRVALAALGLAAFVVLARPQPSVLRAAAMGAVALVALAVGRRPQPVPALASGVVALLVIDPWLGRRPGFVLSVAATAALVLVAPGWARWLRQWLPRPVALALSVPAAAQAVCGPVVVLLNPSVSLVAVPANLLAEPAVAPATMVGVVAAVVAVVHPPSAHLIAGVGCLATAWIVLVARTAASVPAASVAWPAGVGGALALAGLTVAAVLGLAALGRSGAWSRTQRRLTMAVAVGTALAVLAWVWPWSSPFGGSVGRLPLWWPGREATQTWAVAQCDVGQGDALVLRSGPDRAVLVDVGPDPAAVDTCLNRLGVRHLDLVVLTHFHADHVQGLSGALRGRDATRALVSPLAQPADQAAAVRATLARAAVPVAVGRTGDRGTMAAGGWQLSWLVARALSSSPASAASGSVSGFSTGGGSADGSSMAGDGGAPNEASQATLIEVTDPSGRSVRLADLGDLELEGQQGLADDLTRWGSPQVDVVKVSHHGSARQVEGLYRLLAPRVALVGVGAGNDYGHPAPSALAMLQRLQIRTFRSDLFGLVTLRLDGVDSVAGPGSGSGSDGALTVGVERG
jgi:competence protein ComEC